MLLHESFTAAAATAHRADLLAQAERYRTRRHARAATVALRTLRRRPPGPLPTVPRRNADAECRYAMSR